MFKGVYLASIFLIKKLLLSSHSLIRQNLKQKGIGKEYKVEKNSH